MRNIQDYYFKKAKKERYPARSVYKLEEIDTKYRIVRRGFHILDIGCAPGSWSKYLLKKIGYGKITGIDIVNSVKISDKRFTFLQNDILHPDKDFLRNNLHTFDLIISDASPSTTGNPFVDSQSSLAIVKGVFRVAEKILKSHGTVIAKIFQGEDVIMFLKELKKDYEKINVFKPKSSRKESREVFIIAQDRREVSDS